MTPILIAILHFIKIWHCSSQFIGSSQSQRRTNWTFVRNWVAFCHQIVIAHFTIRILNVSTTTFDWLLLLINILIPFKHSPAPTACASVHLNLKSSKSAPICKSQCTFPAFAFACMYKLKRCISICKRVTVDIRLKMQLNINCASGIQFACGMPEFQFALNRKRTLM